MAKKRNAPLAKASLELRKGPILHPVTLDNIGSDTDPCFGKSYDLSTNECKQCGDSELCCLKTAEWLGKTRKELNETHHYKDLEDRIDKSGLKKYYRRLIKGGKTKKDVIVAFQTKYELTHDEARAMYKEFHTSNQ